MHNYVTAIGFMDVYDTHYMDKIIKDYIEKSVENNVVKYVKKEPGKVVLLQRSWICPCCLIVTAIIVAVSKSEENIIL